MKVSIVIRTRNESEGLRKLFPQLRAQTEKDFEVIVVDDHSEDDTIRVAEENGAKVVHLGKEKFTYGKALNIGFSQAEGEFLVSIPGHGLPADEKWLKELIKPLEEDSLIAAAYGAQKAYPKANFLEKIERFWMGNVDFNKFYPYLVNSTSVVRADIWRLTPFDEDIISNEDHHWAFKVAKNGYKIVLSKNSKFWHSHEGSVFKTLNRYWVDVRIYVKIRLGKYG